MGLSELSFHPHRGQSYSEASAEAGERSDQSDHISGRFTAWVTSLCVNSQGCEVFEARGEASMMKLRMRTKFLLSMLLISAGLTWTSLLLVRRTRSSAGEEEHLRRPA